MTSLVPWFDAHLDLACLAVHARDLLAPLDPAQGPWPPGAITLPSLAEAPVRFALATIFTEPVDSESQQTEPQMYPAGNSERAFLVGRAQLEVYLTWRDQSAVSLDLVELLRPEPGVGEIRGGMGVAETHALSLDRRLARLPHHSPLRLAILMENADPIRSPGDLQWWVEHGVRVVGMAWAKPSRYAGGNSTDLPISPMGRELVKEIDRLRVIHDASHLSDRSLAELFELTDRALIASHSNCRALVGGGGFGENQRHLSDESIREITRRGGVIGLNLFSTFLAPGSPPRARIADCVRHIEHICAIAGHTRAVGLGSDMDGGFGADRLPQGVDSPKDLPRLLEALAARGWADGDLARFAWRNWAEFFASTA
ncbi:MAG: dipeptidase [Phycisphaeraceae bacterium]|nr:dipeptidase [Phycisphaeraceae bacterium]